MAALLQLLPMPCSTPWQWQPVQSPLWCTRPKSRLATRQTLQQATPPGRGNELYLPLPRLCSNLWRKALATCGGQLLLPRPPTCRLPTMSLQC